MIQQPTIPWKEFFERKDIEEVMFPIQRDNECEEIIWELQIRDRRRNYESRFDRVYSE